jgi:MFS family permease
MLTAAAGYLGSAGVAATMGRRLLGPDEDEHRGETRAELRNVARGVWAGARHVVARRAAAHALLTITAHRFFYGISTVATLLLYRNYFYRGGSTIAGLGGLALIVLVSGVGYLVAALITPGAVRRVGIATWVVALFLLAGVVQIVLGVPYRQPTMLAAAFLLGVVAQGAKISVDTIVQQATDDGFRGRVFSFYDILFNVAFVAAAAAGAFALPPTGKSYASLGFIAVGYVGTGLAYGWRTRALARRRR